MRAAQSRCDELTVIVPDMAKSAATLLSLGAHHIMMGPASDLGPIDPQLLIRNEWVAAKDIIAAVDDAALRSLNPRNIPRLRLAAQRHHGANVAAGPFRA